MRRPVFPLKAPMVFMDRDVDHELKEQVKAELGADYEGITLREYAAIHAPPSPYTEAHLAAKWAVDYADTLITLLETTDE